MNLEKQLEKLKKEYEEKLAKCNEALASAKDDVERINLDTKKIMDQQVLSIMHRNTLFNKS